MDLVDYSDKFEYKVDKYNEMKHKLKHKTNKKVK